MKGLSRKNITCFIHMFVIGLMAWSFRRVDAACSEKKLWAYSHPNTEHFTDSFKKSFLSPDRGEHCRWVIKSSDEDTFIKLKFSNFKLKNSTKHDEGDCVVIYDGEDQKKLDQLCNKDPQESYTSTERELLIIYKRGEVEGDRGFSMTYSSHSAGTSKAKIIQIAGIIGAILAGIGLTYVGFRVTYCCRCLRKKNGIDNNRAGSTTRERDRLVENAEQGGGNTENIPDATANQNRSQNLIQPSSNGSAPVPVSQEGVTIYNNIDTVTYAAHDSDVESLQDMNEPPPSYESLYLNEVGESVTPPNYSPPQHRSTHPPRRVHTFN